MRKKGSRIGLAHHVCNRRHGAFTQIIIINLFTWCLLRCHLSSLSTHCFHISLLLTWSHEVSPGLIQIHVALTVLPMLVILVLRPV